jgi:pimeloyl-ACP methyl ester carboxylesterase
MPTLPINGTTIAYDDFGQGPPLVLIHGIFVSRLTWYPQISDFARTHRVITCDLRGHGESSVSKGAYSVALFAGDIISLLDALGLERAVCCGHSFGGMVAQELALSYPERVSGLILGESSYGVCSTPWEAGLTAMANMFFNQLLSPENQVKLFARYFGTLSGDVGAYIETQGKQQIQNVTNFQNILQASLSFNSRWRLQQIACPTLILLGQYFHVPWIHLHSYEMLWRIKQASLKYIPRAGHVLNWDNPAAFNQTVNHFLAGLLRNR